MGDVGDGGDVRVVAVRGRMSMKMGGKYNGYICRLTYTACKSPERRGDNRSELGLKDNLSECVSKGTACQYIQKASLRRKKNHIKKLMS